MLTRQITPEMILNMAEALEVAADAFARDVSVESEGARARLRSIVHEAAGTFRDEAARLGAPPAKGGLRVRADGRIVSNLRAFVGADDVVTIGLVRPRLVVAVPEAPLAPVVPFERNPRPRGPE